MSEFKFLQPTDAMERITRHDLSTRFDEILETIDRNNVGFIIADEDKKEYVLCPAKWFDYCFDDDFGCIINSALRYSIGRHTYMPSVVADFVRKYMNVLDTKTIGIMIDDIDREFQYQDKIDYADLWRSLQSDLRKRLNELEGKDKTDGYKSEKSAIIPI